MNLVENVATICGCVSIIILTILAGVAFIGLIIMIIQEIFNK